MFVNTHINSRNETLSITPHNLNADVFSYEKNKVSVLFLTGGNTKKGKERFHNWQLKLLDYGISSVSFNFSGIDNAGLLLKETSLSERINEGVLVAKWMKENISSKKTILYGVSMGGYIGLGVANKVPELFDGLILQAPAAYSKRAHNIFFGKDFSKEIRKTNSWTSSNSFTWLTNYKKPVLLIELEKDKIVPKEITEKYHELKSANQLYSRFILNGAVHNIWTNDSRNKVLRDKVYASLISFIDNI